jgi:hypothetical protein
MSSNIVFADPNDAVLKNVVGASVFWNLADNVDRAALCAALDKAFGSGGSYGHVPAEVTPAAALKRLMGRFTDRSNILKDAKHPMVGSRLPSYGIFRKSEIGRLNDGYELLWAAGIVFQNRDGRTNEDLAQNGLVFSGDVDHETIRESFCLELDLIGPTEQSVWLTNLVRSAMRGLPFGNGMFFISPEHIKHWRELTKLLSGFGITLHEIPAMRSDQAVAAVLSSLTDFCKKFKVELDEEISGYYARKAEGGARKIQDRVIASRQQRCDEQLALIASYEALFDTKLDDIRNQFLECRGAFGRLQMVGELR